MGGYFEMKLLALFDWHTYAHSDLMQKGKIRRVTHGLFDSPN